LYLFWQRRSPRVHEIFITNEKHSVNISPEIESVGSDDFSFRLKAKLKACETRDPWRRCKIHESKTFCCLKFFLLILKYSLLVSLTKEFFSSLERDCHNYDSSAFTSFCLYRSLSDGVECARQGGKVEHKYEAVTFVQIQENERMSNKREAQGE
jgi:hypothetical protein